MKDLTAIIVTFLRDEYLFLCIQSLREQYPDINIVVGDQNPSQEKDEYCKRHNATYIALPYDCGLCVARNKLVKMVETRYILIGDDDFQYFPTANVDKMLQLIREQEEIDLLGGRIMEGGQLKNYQGFIEDNGNNFVYRTLELDCEYRPGSLRHIPADITFNFFVAKKEAVENVLWDEKIKVAYEHSSFFIDFKRAGYKTFFTPDAIVVHKPFIEKRNNENYKKYNYFRTRKNDKKRFFEKYNLDYVIDMNGRRDIYDAKDVKDVDFLISYFERWECLEKLLFSIAKHYPLANIFIGDQSKKFIVAKYNDLYFRLFKSGLKMKPKAFSLGYDSGLSLVRNHLFKITDRPYKLVLEEDFVFTENTKIEKMVEVLEDNPEIGVVGGKVLTNGMELPFEHFFKKNGRTLYHVKNDNEWTGGYKITGCVPNFALMRDNLGVGWDERIKIEGEHTDFYLQMMDTDWKIAYLKDVSINHEKVNSPQYKKLRKRTEFLKILFEKYGIDKIVYSNGYVMEVSGSRVTIYKPKK